jgi:hypothetical protein
VRVAPVWLALLAAACLAGGYPTGTADEHRGTPTGAGVPADARARGGWLESLTGLTRFELLARWNELRGDAYELDSLDRFLDEDDELECDVDPLIGYSGTLLGYQRPVRVRAPFAERLARFERLVSEVAVEVYGRAPKWVRHYGAYTCRATRNRSRRISEHAFGNGIDVIGFDFGALEARAEVDGLPARLRRPFVVRVARHWHAGETAASALHSRFLRELAERLSERRDIFRVMIGPSRPDHADHFHFDMSPWRYVRF